MCVLTKMNTQSYCRMMKAAVKVGLFLCVSVAHVQLYYILTHVKDGQCRKFLAVLLEVTVKSCMK